MTLGVVDITSSCTIHGLTPGIYTSLASLVPLGCLILTAFASVLTLIFPHAYLTLPYPAKPHLAAPYPSASPGAES